MRGTGTLPPPTQQTSGGFNINPAIGGPIIPSPNGSNLPAPVNQNPRQLIRLDTLSGQFTVLVLLGIVISLIGMIASYLILDNIKTNFKGIINNSAPSIVAAQEMGQAIEDADARAVQYQLASRVDVTSPDFDNQKLPIYGDKGLRNTSWNTFQQRRQEMANLIYKAQARVVYYDQGEADAINTISERFMEYVARINIMRYELDQGHREAALAAYKSAHDLIVGNLNNAKLDENGRSPEELSKLKGWIDLTADKKNDCKVTSKPLGIEANIEKLSAINRCELDKAYDDTKATLLFHTALVIGLSVVLILSLLFLCFRYATVTHRVLNPGFALALLGGIALAATLIITLFQAAKDYETVSRSSFTSIEASARARQIATDANADEARLLISPESPGLDSSHPALTSDVRLAFRSAVLKDNFDKKQALLTKEIGNAWSSINYSGEMAALCEVSQNPSQTAEQIKSGSCRGTAFSLARYQLIDADIRKNFSNNLLAQSIILDIGDSNKTFDSFDASMLKLANINKAEFDKSSCNSIGQDQFNTQSCTGGYLSFLESGVLIFFPLIALATIGGFFYIRREL